jgi:hypothetical protein
MPSRRWISVRVESLGAAYIPVLRQERNGRPMGLARGRQMLLAVFQNRRPSSQHRLADSPGRTRQDSVSSSANWPPTVDAASCAGLGRRANPTGRPSACAFPLLTAQPPCSFPLPAPLGTCPAAGDVWSTLVHGPGRGCLSLDLPRRLPEINQKERPAAAANAYIDTLIHCTCVFRKCHLPVESFHSLPSGACLSSQTHTLKQTGRPSTVQEADRSRCLGLLQPRKLWLRTSSFRFIPALSNVAMPDRI